MKKAICCFTLIVLFAAVSTLSAQETRVIWHGHATVEVKTPKGKILLIDPWLKNPAKLTYTDENEDPLASVPKIDYILITHAHFDHLDNAVELGKKTGAKLITNFELGKTMEKLLGYPSRQLSFETLMNIGGEITVADGEVMVAMTQAVHSCGLSNPFAKDDDRAAPFVYAGNPAGFVLKIKDGPVIYHAGDTAYFTDMKTIGETYAPDLAIVPIGGHFTMTAPMAARAAAAVKARWALPIHFKTFPVLAQTHEPFDKALVPYGIISKAIPPNGQLVFKGDNLIRTID